MGKIFDLLRHLHHFRVVTIRVYTCPENSYTGKYHSILVSGSGRERECVQLLQGSSFLELCTTRGNGLIQLNKISALKDRYDGNKALCKYNDKHRLGRPRNKASCVQDCLSAQKIFKYISNIFVEYLEINIRFVYIVLREAFWTIKLFLFYFMSKTSIF